LGFFGFAWRGFDLSLFTSTAANQSLTSAIIGPDPYLQIDLAAGFRYKIGAQIEWSEVHVTDGGISVGFTIGAGSTIVWSVPNGGAAYGSGDTISYMGSTGNRFIELTGYVQVGSSGNATLTFYRGLATASANPTTLVAGSAIYADEQGTDVEATSLTSTTFTAPTIQQNYSVPNISPIGYTVLLGTASTSAIGSRIARRGISFHNPNLTTNIYVCPSNQTAVIGQGTLILAGATVTFFATDLVNVTAGWAAVAASGSNVPLSILEYV
jgi:hypothetical protein